MGDPDRHLSAEEARLRRELERVEAADRSGARPELDRFTQFAVEHLSDATYWMQEDASIIYANEAACSMIGYSHQELLAMKVYQLNVDLDSLRWDGVWGLLKAERKRTFEARHRRKDGRVLEVEITAHFLELDGREYSCAFVRDIGERKLLEQRLRHAEKMEAIGRLAGGVAHDFNNQLSGILGYAEVLHSRLGNDRESLRLVGELSRLVSAAADLTSQLLAFSRRGKFLVQPVDVHALLREVMSILAHSIDKRIGIESSLGAERAWVSGDPSQLQSAMLNLALNARDSMPQGGTLSFSTENVEFPPGPDRRKPPDLGPGVHLALRVRDTGAGMDRQTQERVFEPFFTTKDAGAGTGLGLAAVYGTVKNHRGAIVVDSELGRGTCFTLFFPVGRSSAAKSPRSNSDEPAGMRLSGHVLLVEDEAAVRDACTQMLEALGCTVAAMADGESALDYLREHRNAVDLVILDLVMPGLSGLQVFQAMQTIDPEVRMVAMSGFSLDGDAQELLDAGAKGFLQKPFTMAALAGTVGSALSR